VRGNGRFAVRRWVFESGAPIRALARPSNEIAVAWAAAGDLTWRADGETGDGNAPFMFLPGREVELEGTGVDLRIVCLDRAAFEKTARDVYNDSALELRFVSSKAVSPALAEHWAATLEVYEGVLRDPDVLRSAQVRASAFRHLAIVTLEVFRLAGDAGARARAAAGLTTAFDEASEFIDGHASLPITVGDVAQAAQVSELELDRAFDSHSTGSASDRIAESRLEGAHADLVAADPTAGDTVRAIAERWGFAYPDDFAGKYRERFGESPRDTLDA
jgi:AraC-like DNA-binding protein